MRKPRLIFALLLLAGAGTDGPSAHCPRDPPPGITVHAGGDRSVVKICYEQFLTCQTDTFYRDTLLNELKALYRDTLFPHAIMGYVDSVHRRLVFDTIFDNSIPVFIDTTWGESLWVTVTHELKGRLPSRKLVFFQD